MNREELKNIIPHREPMLLLDEAYVGEDKKAYGSYTVRGDEWFLQGHFPGQPMVPGVIQCEMAAQTCCVLLQDALLGHMPLFAGLDHVKFKSMVKPGDTIKFVCSLLKVKAPFYFAEAKGYVNDKLCLSGELSFALIRSLSGV